jgi:hypothetical protein
MTDAELQAMLDEFREELILLLAAMMGPPTPDEIREWSATNRRAEMKRQTEKRWEALGLDEWHEELKALARTMPPRQKEMIGRHMLELVEAARWLDPRWSGIPRN